MADANPTPKTETPAPTTKGRGAKAPLELSGAYIAKDSLTYMPASVKDQLKPDDPEFNRTLGKHHVYVPLEVWDFTKNKMVPAKFPGTDRQITAEEHRAANVITDIDPDQAADLVARGLLEPGTK